MLPSGQPSVAIDVAPLLGVRTGIGYFCAELLRAVAAAGTDVAAFSVSWSGRDELAEAVPGGVRVVRRPMASRPMHMLWRRFDRPSIRWWTGPVDVVHGTNFLVPPSGRGAAIMTVHDATPWTHASEVTDMVRQYPAVVERALGRGAHIHTVSQFVAAELIDILGVNPDRVHVVRSGVPDVGPADPADGRRLVAAASYVLALGSIERRKNIPALVEAFDEFASQVPDVVLAIAGPDSFDSPRLDDAIARAASSSRIRRLRNVSDPERNALLRGAVAFAYPTLYEGFGFPPLEAMSVGVPVVISPAGAPVEMCGDAALVADPDDSAAFAAALARVVVDDELRSELIDKGRERAGMFNWERAGTEMVDLYTRLATRDR